MNIDFYNSCYNLASLSTCVLKDKTSEGWIYGAKDQISITDRLDAVANYEFLGSDFMSPSDYEIHYFSIDFFRDGKLLDGFDYERGFKKEYLGSLANPDLSNEAKLATLKALKPKLRNKIAALAMSTLLTTDEMNAVIAKSEEMVDLASSLQQNNGKKL